jgi:prepilin-type processing-associated H-X9-DG protein
MHGVNNPDGLEVLGAPDGSATAGLPLENDPPTSYWFNASVTKAGRPDKVISGRSEKVCAVTADAPLVWDTPCGYDNGAGDANIAHADVINICYADGHAKPLQVPTRAKDWLENDYYTLHGSEGWYPEK